MTSTTPPGWYPEPGQEANSPAVERWWDGNAWTAYTRTAPYPAAAPAYPPYPVDVVSGGGSGRRRGAAVAGIITALVLVAGVVGGLYVLGQDGQDRDKAPDRAAPSATTPGPGDGSEGDGPGGGRPDGPSRKPPGVPGAEPGFAVDVVDGIALPVPDGWEGSTNRYGTADMTTGEYPCPGDESKNCVRGGVFSFPAEAVELEATTAEAAAKEDISQNAEDAYGSAAYGEISSHQELRSEKVTVAGQQGYLVRWKVVTRKGDDGYVQSLVFPSPRGTGDLVLVRFGFDINPEAPELSVMDTVTEGIKAADSGDSTGV